jgi:DNA repair exonuclease SbcCD ATPase subunit
VEVIKEKTIVLDRTKIKHEAIVQANKNYKAYQQYISKLAIVEAGLDSTKPTDLLDQITLINEVSKLKQVILTEKRNISSAIEYNQAVQVRNATIDYKREQLDKFKTDLESATVVLEDAQVLLAKTEVLASAMGSKGLIAYKIESMVKVFEQLINKYLQVLADGVFALSFAVEDTKLVLNVHKGEHIVDIKSLSSGEFNRVNTATLLAVRKMMTSISKVDINLLFLDEVVSVLDTEGKDTLVELLLKENNLNSVVVSHGYTHPLAEVITVVKENDISRLVHE